MALPRTPVGSLSVSLMACPSMGRRSVTDCRQVINVINASPQTTNPATLAEQVGVVHSSLEVLLHSSYIGLQVTNDTVGTTGMEWGHKMNGGIRCDMGNKIKNGIIGMEWGQSHLVFGTRWISSLLRVSNRSSQP